MHREELIDFADAMERELQRHDPTKGDSWKTMGLGVLTEIMQQTYSKWTDSWASTNGGDTKIERDELVDMANLCMMLWHRVK